MTHLIDVYKRLPRKIVSGAGSYVYDDEGRRYLDFYGAHAVSVIGHSHPKLVGALKTQIDKLLFYSNAVHLEHQEEAASKLVAACPKPLARAFFVNSGAEAVENALKIARKLTGRSLVVSCEGSFHGRTLGALAATGIERYRSGAGVAASPSQNSFVPFGDEGALHEAFASEPPASLLIEPIQSLAGVREAGAPFFETARRLCTEHGTLLIYDELQTGMGRTGSFCFAPRHGVTPDLMTLGKGLASGIPMGAVVATESIAMKLSYGDLGTTFGGGPLACVALDVTLDVLAKENLAQNAARLGAELKRALLEFSSVESVTGEGLLLGVRTKDSASSVQSMLLEKGVIVGTSDDPHVVRLMPPLSISAEDVTTFVDVLGASQ